MPVPRSLDRRSRRSRAALESALLELIAERDLTQLAVSDVTGRADVHRSTFYEHYTDVHDLAASACTSMFDELLSATSRLSTGDGTADSARDSLTTVFAHVAEHRRLYRSLLGPDGSARVLNHLLERTADSVRHGMAESGAKSTSDSSPVSAFLAGALLGVIIDWLRRDCGQDPERLSEAVWPHLIAATGATRR
ncbi:TetR-like C-terminal domain-containing protein [Prauserella cavernicola]|uniref:TetR family transcriptional regulator C-terminal domain-containing protein n=1 Tax=Prauserella cavernicola TaxID=2800127 RepID=A0A934QQ43_9PSEU|nr:TetR-like C-terminal domain-containing protein [Prauserella cavernicola]MBK1783664.1 TetR family transcriptional regulator C-terminal domain-containing protein [Prauserella cavernicola]